MKLTNKKILLIIPYFFNYHTAMKQALEQMGNYVDMFEERADNSFYGKSIVRVNYKLHSKTINNYYYNITKIVEKTQYDYVLIIKGESITIKMLKAYRKAFASACFVLYLWDSVVNTRGVLEKLPYFDKVFSFDPQDCEKYSTDMKRIIMYPTYYIDSYKAKEYYEDEIEYDFCFIGTAHGDRPRIAKAIARQCEEHGGRTFIYLYCSHFLIFLYNKLFNKEYTGIDKKDIMFKIMSHDEIRDIMKKSCAVVDIEHKKQTGLTLRIIESIGMKKKVITTNPNVANYDFFDENNIMIIDRSNPQIMLEFLNKQYKEIDEEIYKKYSISSWLEDILVNIE